MDGYQFVASLFQSLTSLAWPAAIVACVWLFREKLNTILPLLRMKYKDFDISFRLEQAEKEVAALPPPAAPVEIEPTPEEKDRFEKLAEISPRAAMLELRSDIEEAIRSLVRTVVKDTSGQKRATSTLVNIRMLRGVNAIRPHTSALLDDLRVIGNQAAHGTNTEFTKDDAMRFKALAERAIKELAEAEAEQMFK